MKLRLIMGVIPVLFCLSVWADVQSDLSTLTGGREVRAVWLRIPWCDSNYSPIPAYRNEPAKNTRICVMSTSEAGGVRYLNDGLVMDHHWDLIFITRKSGSHVVWNEPASRKSYIQAFDGKTPKVDLNLGTDWEVISLHYNPATGQENLFVRSSDKRRAFRIPLRADYTPDLSGKTEVIASSWSGGIVDDAFSVSADGTMAGGAFPWPETKMIDMVDKKVYRRQVGGFGCNTNIAPDNSYRFFHFYESHDGLYMFGPDLTTQNWGFKVNENLPGSTLSYVDSKLPRWTNNVQFMSMVYPGPHTGIGERGNFNLSAAQVKALSPGQVGNVILGKFRQDFRGIEKWARIAGGDVRNIEGTAGAMVWIAPDPVGLYQQIARDSWTRDRISTAQLMTGKETVRLTTLTGHRIATQVGGKAPAWAPGVYIATSPDRAGSVVRVPMVR